jgi:hypothetical protein
MSSEERARIRRWATDFPERLPPADLRQAFLSDATTLNGIALGTPQQGYVRVADVRWGGVNLAVVALPPANLLGDEQEARRTHEISDYQAAVRADRQLSVALEGLGLMEAAEDFAYCARVLQRHVFLRQRKFGKYLVSLGLAMVAGYGYRFWPIVRAYGLIVIAFAAVYFFSGPTLGSSALDWQRVLGGVADAFQASLNAIHGRVFFANFSPDTLRSWFATVESIFGIVVEGAFVAMLIQRFFDR